MISTMYEMDTAPALSRGASFVSVKPHQLRSRPPHCFGRALRSHRRHGLCGIGGPEQLPCLQERRYKMHGIAHRSRRCLRDIEHSKHKQAVYQCDSDLSDPSEVERRIRGRTSQLEGNLDPRRPQRFPEPGLRCIWRVLHSASFWRSDHGEKNFCSLSSCRRRSGDPCFFGHCDDSLQLAVH
jgi:hypothetical protein